MKRHHQYLVEDFPMLRVDDIRYRIGGRRKLNGLGVVYIDLPGGRTIPLMLSRLPSNLGGGAITYAVCPACGHRARVLRIVPAAEGLLCAGCVMKKFQAKYASQLSPRGGLHDSSKPSEAATLAEPRGDQYVY